MKNLLDATNRRLEKLLLTDFARDEVSKLLKEADPIELKGKTVKSKKLMPEYHEIEKLMDFLYDVNPERPTITIGEYDSEFVSWNNLPKKSNHLLKAISEFSLSNMIENYKMMKHARCAFYNSGRLNVDIKGRHPELISTFAHEYGHHILNSEGVLYEGHQILHEGFARSSARYAMKAYSKIKQDDEYYLASKRMDLEDLNLVKLWQASKRLERILKETPEVFDDSDISREELEMMAKMFGAGINHHAQGNALFLILEKYFRGSVSARMLKGDLSPLEIFYR